jgi:hypothetical protein
MGRKRLKEWPCPVTCYGRHYEAKTQTDLYVLVRLLESGQLMAANKYRVAAMTYSRWRNPDRCGNEASGADQ